jgi:replicative DNA helicase
MEEKPTAMKDAIVSAFGRIQSSGETGNEIGISTGLRTLDLLLGRLRRGEVTVLAGPSGAGKTSLACAIAANVATSTFMDAAESGGDGIDRPGLPAVIFSLECSRDRLALRMSAAAAGVSLRGLRDGRLRKEDWEALTSAVPALTDAFLFIEATPALSISHVRTKLAALTEPPAGLAVVDYLQLMNGRDIDTTRDQQISEIMRGLKATAAEFDVSIIAVSQLNRSVEARFDRTPQLADLRDSGSIAQDADNVVFLHDPAERFAPPALEDADVAFESSDPKVIRVILAKQRDGHRGVCRLLVDPVSGRWSDVGGERNKERAQ